ncbi:hypothetical protein BRC79_02105 [Halobacteriales archaeon QH_8_67_27]|nr:MAG: hypothetical protein BRC79_02105 [Halobacteriales archaeon QH_8_67_27]
MRESLDVDRQTVDHDIVGQTSRPRRSEAQPRRQIHCRRDRRVLRPQDREHSPPTQFRRGDDRIDGEFVAELLPAKTLQ